MDAYEATRIVFSRLQVLDPENAAKIMGLLLIQDDGVKDMIRLAFGPENLLHSVIIKARKDLGLFPSWTPTSPFSHLPFSRSSSFNEEDVVNSNGGSEFLSFLSEQNTADPVYNGWEQRSCLSPDGFGWRPCLYYQRGFCKNGSACKFLHGPVDDITTSIEQELMLMRSKSQRLAASVAAFPYSPTGPSSNKCFNFMVQQQQNESQRAAAVALMLENENQKFLGRARLERSDFAGMVNPSSRQIYLTFPADSTFREEDVSNYFSIYGPVQDVRIPYQQKRMFGFVTFVYPETVKLILAKGNPHFVCDARVLVKPYKEKGKIPEKKQLQTERIDFSGCNSPGLDSRDPFDLQQLANARMPYGGNNQDALLRRKLEEQQAAAELQQAIEMQGRRFMGLQLLDIKNRSISSATAPILSPLTTPAPTPTLFNNTDGISSNGSHGDSAPLEDKSLSTASAVVSNAAAGQTAVNTVESAASEPTPNEDVNYQESAEHNLPENPFASPTKSLFANNLVPLGNEENSLCNNGSSGGDNNGHLLASTLLAPASPLETMASYQSCFFQIPRFSSGHGAVGL